MVTSKPERAARPEPPAPEPAPPSGELVGVWELRTIDIEYRDDGTRRPAKIPAPEACLMFTPLGRLLSMLTRPSHAQWGAEREGEALFRSTFAYSGRYRLEQERWVTRIDRTWNDAWTDGVQTHAYRLAGSRLTVMTPWLISDKADDRVQRMLFGFERMKTRQ